MGVSRILPTLTRHEERSLDGPDPSDVDLLVVLNGNRDAVRSQILALVHTAGLAEDRHLGCAGYIPYSFEPSEVQWRGTDLAMDGLEPLREREV